MPDRMGRVGALVHIYTCGVEQIVRFARALSICLLLTSSAIAAANSQETRSFDIDAGSAVHSLNQYAHQAGLEIGFPADSIDDIHTNALKGRYDRTEALDILLLGTGLVANHGNGRIVIHRATTSATKKAGEARTAERDRLASRSSNELAVKSGVGSLDKASAKLEEIIVTGSQIRGTVPVGSNLITLDREYIEMSGLATTQEILQTLPQNVGLGANENMTTVGIAPGTFNYGEASSINLRGLGTASTLALLNGRRSASGGGRGEFVDLNSVPPSAIERVEVLPDGASAIYGSDAIGGVVNVILREDYDGSRTMFRYAPDTNNIEELQFGQIFGKSWSRGNVLAIYNFYGRSALTAADREYTRDSNLTRLGGTDHSRAASNPGNINRYTSTDGTQQTVQFAVPPGQDGSNLMPSDLIGGVENENLQNIRQGSTVLPDQKRHSLFATVTQNLTDTAQLFVESRWSTRDVETRPQQLVTNNLIVPSTNPFFVDPFGGSTELRINYSFADDYGAQRISSTVDTYALTTGARVGLGEKWEIETYLSYNIEETFSLTDNFPNTALLREALADTDPQTSFNPFGDGSHTNPATLAGIEGFRRFDIRSQLSVLNVRADGEVFRMPGGAAKLAIGGQVRDDGLQSDQLSFATTLEAEPSAANFDLDRDITAIFSEIFLPVVSEKNSRKGLRQLAFSVAGRYERYSDFGDSFNPKLGVSWIPLEGLSLRSTFGTSFRAPLLVELDDSQRAYQVVTVTDPASPTGTTNALYLLGNNPTLEAQEGTTWTAGFDIEPVGNAGLRLSVTYFETEVDKLISLPGNLITLPFLQPEIYGQILDRNPDEARLVALLSEPRCFCGSATPDDIQAIVDFRRQNLAKASLSGVDANIAYGFNTDYGSFSLSLFGSHLFDFKEQLVKAPMQDNLDTIAKPNSLQLRGSLSWVTGNLSVALVGEHVGDYTDDRSDPERSVGSWTTWDLRLSYHFDTQGAALFDDTSVSLGVRNLFDRDPPFVDLSNGVGFDAINANALQRDFTLQLTKNW